MWSHLPLLQELSTAPFQITNTLSGNNFLSYKFAVLYLNNKDFFTCHFMDWKWAQIDRYADWMVPKKHHLALHRIILPGAGFTHVQTGQADWRESFQENWENIHFVFQWLKEMVWWRLSKSSENPADLWEDVLSPGWSTALFRSWGHIFSGSLLSCCSTKKLSVILVLTASVINQHLLPTPKHFTVL